MSKRFYRPLAILAVLALAACGGGSNPVYPGAGTIPNNPVPSAPVPLVGIGDSLTAGMQADGLLGDTTATSSLSALPGGALPVTQQNGFWALLYQQLTGQSAAGQDGPLPLIKAPGLGDQLVVSSVSPPFAPTHSSPCDAFNDAVFSPTAWTTTRLNPNAQVLDFGIPSITTHEAIGMAAPLTGPPNGKNCGYIAIPGDITSGSAQILVSDESEFYYPVLGGFQKLLPSKATELSVAVALKPQVATVWLGANDLLKVIEGGPANVNLNPLSDSPTQYATDLTTIITSLQKVGAKVVVADLPDLLGNGSTEPPVPRYVPDTKIAADLQALGVPAPAAGAVQAYIQTTYTVKSGVHGFLTFSGFFSVASELQSTTPTLTPNLDPNGPGSGDGPVYLDGTWSQQMMGLIAAYNSAVHTVVASTGVALAPIEATFQSIASTGVPLAPGVTLTLQFGGGIVSFDGLHPTNVGYALVANTFINALRGAPYNMTSLTPLSNAQIGAIAQTDPYNPFVIKALNPAWPFPLP